MMIAGVILAAGRSQRMGQQKLLLPWHGTSMVRHVAQQALRSRLDKLIVVVGHRAEHVRAAVIDLPVHLVHNAAFLDGQSTSLRGGVGALDKQAEAAVILLADQPMLQPATIDLLIATFLNTRAPIVAPRYHGQRGNPVLFARQMFPDLQTLDGDQGARRLLSEYSHEVQWVDVEDEGILLDIDTPEAYQQLVDRVEPM